MKKMLSIKTVLLFSVLALFAGASAFQGSKDPVTELKEVRKKNIEKLDSIEMAISENDLTIYNHEKN